MNTTKSGRYDPLLERNLDELESNEIDYKSSKLLEVLSKETEKIGNIEVENETFTPEQISVWLMELSKQVQEISTLEHQTRVMREHLE